MPAGRPPPEGLSVIAITGLEKQGVLIGTSVINHELAGIRILVFRPTKMESITDSASQNNWYAVAHARETLGSWPSFTFA